MVFAGDAIFLIDVVRLAVEHVALRMAEKIIHDLFDGVGKEHVIGIQVRLNFAMRPGEPLVDRVGLPVVTFRNPWEAVAVGLENFHRFVG